MLAAAEVQATSKPSNAAAAVWGLGPALLQCCLCQLYLEFYIAALTRRLLGTWGRCRQQTKEAAEPMQAWPSIYMSCVG